MQPDSFSLAIGRRREQARERLALLGSRLEAAGIELRPLASESHLADASKLAKSAAHAYDDAFWAIEAHSYGMAAARAGRGLELLSKAQA